MKKLISLMLALMLVFSLATVAMAATDDPYKGKLDAKGVVSKNYVINSGTAPAEDFKFSFVAVSYTNADGVTYEVTNGEYTVGEGSDAIVKPVPSISDVTISYTTPVNSTAALSNTFTVDPSQYDLGVYTYVVSESNAKQTPGVKYSNENLYLVLTILRDESNNKHYVAAMHYESLTGNKNSGFTNEYNAGSLSVQKQITGNMADMGKKFTFTITLTPKNGSFSAIQNTIAAGSPNGEWNKSQTTGVWTYTVSLGDDETVTINNIPAGTTYTVAENAENYTASYTKNSGDSTTYTNNAPVSGSIIASTSAGSDGEPETTTNTDTYVFTNKLNNDSVDTGITLDSLPFVLILAVCAGAVVLFVIKRRNSVEF